jgi:hypothetical protein
MGKSEFVVKVDTYLSYDVFQPTFHAWCNDHTIGELDICCIGLSVIMGTIKV